MNKSELVIAISKKVDGSITKKDIDLAIEKLIEAVKEEVATGLEVTLVDFGRFSAHTIPERKGRNPKTGEVLVIPEHKKVVFKVGKGFKDAVNKNG